MWHVHSAIYKVESITVQQTCSTYVLLLQPGYKVAGGQAGGGREERGERKGGGGRMEGWRREGGENEMWQSVGGSTN